MRQKDFPPGKEEGSLSPSSALAFVVQSPSIASSIDSPERRLMRWPELSLMKEKGNQILIKELN